MRQTGMGLHARLTHGVTSDVLCDQLRPAVPSPLCVLQILDSYNLINICLRSHLPSPARFFFCSSVSAAGNTPKPASIPETSDVLCDQLRPAVPSPLCVLQILDYGLGN
jgi:hypothetical protein